MADTTPKARRVYVRGTLAERFWAHVHKTETCWLWTGAISARGYGAFHVKHGQNGVAHRIAYELTYGMILPGFFCCHRCDVPLCVRPDHLFLGTTTDNMRDMVRKGRHHSTLHPELRPHGEAHYFAKLTEANVREIRRLYAEEHATKKGLARTFGVSRRLIQTILSGKGWTHVR